jgi:CHAT domain/Trypsin-like peptidase domain
VSAAAAGVPAGFLGRVLAGGGDPVGTCFQVLAGVVVTARHVVQEATGALPVVWQEQDPDVVGSVVQVEGLRLGSPAPTWARVVTLDVLNDLAVLAPVDPWPAALPRVVASDGVTRTEPVGVTGHGLLEDADQQRVPRYLEAVGQWVGQSMFDDAVRLAVVESRQVLRGMSGAPVLRLSDGAVVGVVTARYNSDSWMRDSVWVIRTEDLQALLGQIPTGGKLLVEGRASLGEPADVLLRVDATTVGVSCPQLGIEATGAHQGVRPGLQGALLDVRLARTRTGDVRDTDARVGLVGVEASLRQVGRLMAESFLPAPVAAALGQVVTAAERESMPVLLGIDIGVDNGAAALRGLPWESLPVPGSDIPVALHHLVTVYRRVVAATPRDVPGPLRIVVAIAAPTAGSHGAVLGYETELRAVLAAVKGARSGNAQVRIVPFATPTAIREALAGGDVHVLHLSGHGTPGGVVLEHEDGAARLVSAEEFVKEAIPPGCMPPVIALAACYTNVPANKVSGTSLVGFADGLVAAGAPVVIGTETSVTDRYATRVFAAVYAELARSPHPDPVAALSRARRVTQDLFAASTDPRDQAVSGLDEWAVVTVLASAPATVLFDPAKVRVAAPVLGGVAPAFRRVGPLVGLEPGLFVGRRVEQRMLPRALTGLDPASAAGVVVHGIGGIGKTTLATELVRRAQALDADLVVVALTGQLLVETILTAVAARLRQVYINAGVLDQALPLLQALGQADLPWHERLEVLQANILDQVPLLLVLDNFEDNLSDPDQARGVRILIDEVLAGFLSAWVAAPGRSHLLVTCRYQFSLPDAGEDLLDWRLLGPLTLAETMKLVWSLPNLDDLPDHELHELWASVGSGVFPGPLLRPHSQPVRLPVAEWFAWCESNGVDPLVGVQRAHVELYIRGLGDPDLMDSEATMARNEAPVLHVEGDLAVVLHPHACHESCELPGKERRFAIGRTEGVNVLTCSKHPRLNRSWGPRTQIVAGARATRHVDRAWLLWRESRSVPAELLSSWVVLSGWSALVISAAVRGARTPCTGRGSRPGGKQHSTTPNPYLACGGCSSRVGATGSPGQVHGAGLVGPPGSDLKTHLNDRLGNRPQADVVVTGVRAHEFECLSDRDRMAMGGDPLGLFDDDP